MRIAIIDADVLAYQACYRSAVDVLEPDGTVVASVDADAARDDARIRVESLQLEVQAQGVVITFGGTSNWRKTVWRDYKAHRAGRKPVGYWHVVEALKDEFPVHVIPSLEADDCCGLLQTEPRDDGIETVVVSEDKDLATVPGLLYVPREGAMVNVRTIEADRAHMLQTLTGDPSDGYPGCPGIGPVKAVKALNQAAPHQWWRTVVGVYASKGLTEEDALTQAVVARILRHGEYDHESGEGVMWHPGLMSVPQER